MSKPDSIQELEGPHPTQILRAETYEVSQLLANFDGLVRIVCDPVMTTPGDRIAIYEAHTKRGIVALADVHTPASVDDGGTGHALAMLTELEAPLSRRALLDAGLGNALRRMS